MPKWMEGAYPFPLAPTSPAATQAKPSGGAR
jgi:hypothetical protein